MQELMNVGFAKGMEQQTQTTAPIIVHVPAQDNTAVWVAGVAVPLIIAIIGWWLQHKWHKANPNMPLTVANYKKSREK